MFIKNINRSRFVLLEHFYRDVHKMNKIQKREKKKKILED